jgi:hypothetical protein
MKELARRLGPLVLVAGILTACGAQGSSSPGAQSAARPARCATAGAWCHWDSQCCSGRCNVDTGCGG